MRGVKDDRSIRERMEGDDDQVYCSLRGTSLSSRQIAKKTKIPWGRVSKSLKRLKKNGEIESFKANSLGEYRTPRYRQVKK